LPTKPTPGSGDQNHISHGEMAGVLFSEPPSSRFDQLEACLGHSHHEIPKSNLPEFHDTIHFRELKRFIFVPSLTDFTAVGEPCGVVKICEMFFKAGDQWMSDLASSRQLTAKRVTSLKASRFLMGTLVPFIDCLGRVCSTNS
jgi:hypothetical protein